MALPVRRLGACAALPFLAGCAAVAPSAHVTTASVTASSVAQISAAADNAVASAESPVAPADARVAPADARLAPAGPVALVPSRGGVRLGPTARGPLSGKVVVVDPGHNGRYIRAVDTRLVPAGNGATKACNTSGTATRAGWPEHAFTWDVGVRLTAELRSLGATVLLTRPNDRGVGPCVNERAAIGDRGGADLVISIHADGNASATARGFHVITSNAMSGGVRAEHASAALAVTVRDAFRSATHMPVSTYTGGGRGITVRHDIAGLNLSTAPGVMLEAGNMFHRTDAAMLTTPAFRQAAADALAGAVRTTLAP